MDGDTVERVWFLAADQFEVLLSDDREAVGRRRCFWSGGIEGRRGDYDRFSPDAKEVKTHIYAHGPLWLA